MKSKGGTEMKVVIHKIRTATFRGLPMKFLVLDCKKYLIIKKYILAPANDNFTIKQFKGFEILTTKFKQNLWYQEFIIKHDELFGIAYTVNLYNMIKIKKQQND